MSSGSDAPSIEDPYATIGFALKRAQQMLRSRLDKDLRAIGLTTPQYAVLTFLEIEPGASNANLARKAFVTPQTMQTILVTLERAGLIIRRQQAGHGRIQATNLTEQGFAALQAAGAMVANAEERLRQAAPPIEPAAAAALLSRLAEALE